MSKLLVAPCTICCVAQYEGDKALKWWWPKSGGAWHCNSPFGNMGGCRCVPAATRMLLNTQVQELQWCMAYQWLLCPFWSNCNWCHRLIRLICCPAKHNYTHNYRRAYAWQNFYQQLLEARAGRGGAQLRMSEGLYIWKSYHPVACTFCKPMKICAE